MKKENKAMTNRQTRAFVRLIRELESSTDHDTFQNIMTDIENILEPNKKGSTEATSEAQST